MEAAHSRAVFVGIHAVHHGPYIGFCGGAEDSRLDEASTFIHALLDLIGTDFTAICGGTKGGIPELVTNVMVDRGVPVVGVFPERAKSKKVLPHLTAAFPVKPRCAYSEWGDESEVFVKHCDAMIFFGGGWGTLIEYSHAMKINASRISHGHRPIALVPLVQFGGLLKLLPQSCYVMGPTDDQITPLHAARYLAAMVHGIHFDGI